MTVKDGAKRGSGRTLVDRPETTGPMLALLQERLEQIRGAKQPVLKLGPEDIGQLCESAGVDAHGADAFRTLVRRRLVRLRGRWRENRSAVRAPVYVEGLTEAGLRLLRESGFGEEWSLSDRLPERVPDGRKEGERR
jgi:hypothetical protein